MFSWSRDIALDRINMNADDQDASPEVIAKLEKAAEEIDEKIRRIERAKQVSRETLDLQFTV